MWLMSPELFMSCLKNVRIVLAIEVVIGSGFVCACVAGGCAMACTSEAVAVYLQDGVIGSGCG